MASTTTPYMNDTQSAENVTDTRTDTCISRTIKIHYPIFLIGICLSIFSCLTAFLVYILIRDKIFRGSRGQLDRDGTKHWIHCNFIASFLLRDIGICVSLSVYLNGAAESLSTAGSMLIYIHVVYAVMANFWWMFAEALWIYLGVFFPNQYQQWRYVKAKMCFLGWVIPALLILIWVAIEHQDLINKKDSDKLQKETPAIVCIVTPIYLVIFLNLIMTTHVLHYFGHMMRDEEFREKRLARATLVLSFLLGITFTIPFIVVYLVPENSCAFKIISFIEDVLSCIQGLFVSIFIIQNEEVLQYAKRCIKIPHRINIRGSSRSSRSSHGSTMNTTAGSTSNKTGIGAGYQPCECEMDPQSP